MFKELENLIKSDQESLDKFEKLKSKFLSDKRAYDKKLLSKARIQAVVLAVATVISLLFLLYAFQIKSEFDQKMTELTTQIEQLELKLEDCK